MINDITNDTRFVWKYIFSYKERLLIRVERVKYELMEFIFETNLERSSVEKWNLISNWPKVTPY